MAAIGFKEVFTAVRAGLNVAGVTALVANANVYRGIPPRSAPIPNIRMQVQSESRDISTIGRRVYQYFYISVIGVANNPDSADEISLAIDAALERVSLSIGSSQHGNTMRVAQINYDEYGADDEVYTHSGGIYEIGVKAI